MGIDHYVLLRTLCALRALCEIKKLKVSRSTENKTNHRYRICLQYLQEKRPGQI